MNMLKVNESGGICVSGDLVFDTVPVLEQEGKALIQQKQEAVFDLSEVTLADNSGVALLVSWARNAKSAGKKIEFINLPKQLLDLVEASGLKDVLLIG